MDLTIYRHTYNDNNTIGHLHDSVDGYFCNTLEDKKRADNVKVYGETCIPAGIYDYEVTWSPKFKRQMILIKRVPMFKGIRIHGGNTEKDSLGCPLVAFNTDGNKIWCTAEKKLTAKAIKHGGKGKIHIKDAFLSYDKINKELRS